MSSPIDLRFRMTPEDYIATTRRVLLRSITTWVVVTIFAMASVTRLLLWAVTAEPSIDAILLFVIGCLYPVWFPIVSVRFRLSDKAYQEQAWQFTDSNVNQRMKDSSFQVRWNQISQILDSGRAYLLYINRSVFAIPKRVFESPQQENAFRNLAKHKVKTNLK